VVWDSVHPFECPTRVFYGWGALADVGNRLAELGVTKALIVSDPGVEKVGHVATVARAITGAGVDVVQYTGVQPNPTVGNVESGYAVYTEQQCNGLVGLGGGSAMDAAKGIGVVASNGGGIADYTGREQIPRDLPPLICLPTTCGTGSEVTFNAVITDEVRHVKLPFVSRKLAPKVALVDPELVVGAPASVVSSTAADALSHAIECYLNTASDPLIDALTLASIRMIGKNLAAAVNQRDRNAIAQLSLASTMAGVAFNMNANAVVHAASTPVTARHDVPHGVANAIFLPAGVRFCIPAVPDRIIEIGHAIGAPIGNLTGAGGAEMVVKTLSELLASVGLPRSLSEYGIDVSTMDLEGLAADAMKSRSVPLNPRPITEQDLMALYREVM